MLLHGLEQRRLGFGRRSIDFVGEDHVCKDRPLDELQYAPPIDFIQDLGSGYVGGHEVRCELDPTKLQVKHLGNTANQQGFGQPRRSRDQTMRT